MKSKFKKLMAAALVLCLMLALLPAGVLAEGEDVLGAGDGDVTPLGTTHYITANVEGAGGAYFGGDGVTIDPATRKTVASAGIEVTAWFNPNSADVALYSFSMYKTGEPETKVDYSGSNGEYQFTMPDYDITIDVKFAQLHTVNYDPADVTVNSASVMEGDWVVVTPVAKEGYDLDYVWYQYVNGGQTRLDPTNGVYQFVMGSSDVTVGATFKEKPVEPPVDPTYTVTASGNYGGSVWVDNSTGLSYGETVTVNVEPYDGYWLESLTVNGVDVTDQVSWDWYWYYGRTGTYSFTVTGDTNVYATFATRYDDDIACIYDGRYGNVTVKVWDEVRDKFVTTTDAQYGDLVAVIVEPFSGYAMSDLTIRERNDWDYVSYDSSWKYDNVYYFYMPGDDVNIYVDFTEAASEHIVYVDTAKNGTLKADTTWAAYGQKVYVTATPDKGYELSSLFVKTAKGDQLKVYEAKKADTYYFYMPDEYVTVSAWFAPEASALPFADVSYTNWYYDAVKFVYDKGIMDGVSYYRFAPDATITRGMVVTMLWRMAGEPYESSAGFTDVASGRYYSTAVAWAAKNGIVEGMTSSTFAPDQAITREQLASILYRYARWLGFSGTGSDISGYTDAGKVSGYAYDAMCWAVKTGVVTGTSAKVLDPQGTATRAAAAQMFMNFYNYIY